MTTAISVEGIGKKYFLGLSRKAIRKGKAEPVPTAIRPSKRRELRERTAFWALRDVSFEVNEGEVLGVIGRNGAGKSTLLKILSRITDPTEGRAEMRGRVGSLLEVGTGFHPELTGRENVYLNGAILGMKKQEIDRKFDEIVAFSEIEKFIDTPVKRYSSGMYVRLAFSVAAHLEPEILMVDEVLAVGDYGFQRKCLGRMGEAANEGRTVFMVSHNLGAINRLCTRALWIESGEVVVDGGPADVTTRYLLAGAGDTGRRAWDGGYSDSDKGELKIHSLSMFDDAGEVSSQLDIRRRFYLELDYEVTSELPYCRVGIVVLTAEGVIVFESFDTDGMDKLERRQPGHYRARCEIPGDFLNAGQHFVNVRAGIPNVKPLAHIEGALSFTIEDTGAIGQGEFTGLPRSGIVRPELNWTTKRGVT